MKIAALIPARYKSSRYPGKPLVSLCGKPMIIHVCEAAAAAVGRESTFVATDSAEIAAVVHQHGFQSINTSESCLTGTDRIAEAVAGMDADMIVNVQGDEPMVSPASICEVIARKTLLPGWIVNGMARVQPAEDPSSKNLPKVVATESGRLLYMSRALVPSLKDEKGCSPAIWKQVCIYAFERSHLEAFIRFGRKSLIESAEDIEILRFMELGVPVQMIELPASSLAVDCPEDVPRVEAAMKAAALLAQ